MCIVAAPVAAIALIVALVALFGTDSADSSGVAEVGRSIIFSKRYVIVGLAQLMASGIFSYMLKSRIFPGALIFGLVSGMLTASVMIFFMSLVDSDSLFTVLAKITYTMAGVCTAYGIIGAFAGRGLYKFIHPEEQ